MIPSPIALILATAERENAILLLDSYGNKQSEIRDGAFKCNIRIYGKDHIVLFDAFSWKSSGKSKELQVETHGIDLINRKTLFSVTRPVPERLLYPFTADYSPESKRLLFLDLPGRLSVWEQGKRRILHTNVVPGEKELSGSVYSPQWSPLGDKVAFLAITDVGLPDLFVKPMHGNRSAEDLGLAVSEYCWNPNNQKIVVCHQSDFGNYSNRLLIVNVNTGKTRDLRLPRKDQGPAVKGQSLEPEPEAQLTIMRRDSNKDYSHFYHPRWSPNGKEIAVVVSTKSGESVWVFSVEDGRWRRCTEVYPSCHSVCWSSSGDKIAYLVSQKSREHEVFSTTFWLENENQSQMISGEVRFTDLRRYRDSAFSELPSITEFALI